MDEEKGLEAVALMEAMLRLEEDLVDKVRSVVAVLEIMAKHSWSLALGTVMNRVLDPSMACGVSIGLVEVETVHHLLYLHPE